jgi:hypothetical protein
MLRRSKIEGSDTDRLVFMPRTPTRTINRSRRKGPARARLSGTADEKEVVNARDSLRQGRQALTQLQGELDSLLAAIRNPGSRIDPSAPDRLRDATRLAASALASLPSL